MNNKEKLFSKVDWDCGKIVYKYYFQKHQQTYIHKFKLKDIL
jgi:hypothetical protein